jgi:hypothetical protein
LTPVAAGSGSLTLEMATVPYDVSALTLQSGPPGSLAVIRGTLGAGGWSLSPVSLSWIVAGAPAPTTSGCAAVAVPNTSGTTHTCSAANALGADLQSVTITEDTVPPAVKVKIPRNGPRYRLNQKVAASYTCTDATSGVAACAGPVADGVDISTSTPGTNTFQRVGTDNAGKGATAIVSYTVK